MTTDPTVPAREELAPLIEWVAREAQTYLEALDERPVRDPGLAAAEATMVGALPEHGVGAAAALRELVQDKLPAALASAGPRYFHFVMGGVTPAALGADWLATVIDQVGYAWLSSPLAVRLEQLCLAWLRELFLLPAEGGGLITTGATMANFVGLAAARQWWGDRHGVDVAQQGLAGLPSMPVLSSGFVHASSIKALAMLGLGRTGVRRFTRDAIGHLDRDALAAALRELDGAPAVIIANAGEVNAGEFDPIAELAELAAEHGAWLHVDGAFGLFARLPERTRPLTEGVQHADSICVDGHKWLNVPYDCGFAFVRDTALLSRTFAYEAAYLQQPDDPHPNFGVLGPESSRRARSLAVWATLRAYGRSGHRRLIEGHLELAQRLARRVDEAPDLERLAEVPLNIVCFRFAPVGVEGPALDELNTRLGEALLEDGRFYAGTTRRDGVVALRPALVNWRTRPSDVDAFVDVVRELGARLIGPS